MLTLGNITFACQDPSRLANFWAAALAYSVEKLPPELVDLLVAEGKDMNMAAAISDPSGKGPRMFFEKKLKSQTAVLPIHLDYVVMMPRLKLLDWFLLVQQKWVWVLSNLVRIKISGW